MFQGTQKQEGISVLATDVEEWPVSMGSLGKVPTQQLWRQNCGCSSQFSAGRKRWSESCFASLNSSYRS